MDIDKWIENYEFCCDGKTFVVEVDDLKELLQTHALVPREPSKKQLINWFYGKTYAEGFKAMLSDKE